MHKTHITSFSHMELFRQYLRQEYTRRSSQNPRYSLRAYAKHLGISHATLSTMLSGKRKITNATILRLSKPLGLSPSDIQAALADVNGRVTTKSNFYYILQNDAFSYMSDWYYDAILELIRIRSANHSQKAVAAALGVSQLQVKLAFETLERLELLRKDKRGRYQLNYSNTTNILDPDFTTAAQKKYQQAILEKSAEALGKIDRKKRDHTSTTLAIQSSDIAKVKKLIEKFRHDLNTYLQRSRAKPDEVYQLQVSFFPLTDLKNLKQGAQE